MAKRFLYDALQLVFFFILLGILLLPTIILGLNGKRFQGYNMFISIIVLALIFAHDLHGVIALCIFTLWQVLLIRGYLAYRLKANSGFVFSMVIASILPLFYLNYGSFLPAGASSPGS